MNIETIFYVVALFFTAITACLGWWKFFIERRERQIEQAVRLKVEEDIAFIRASVDLAPYRHFLNRPVESRKSIKSANPLWIIQDALMALFWLSIIIFVLWCTHSVKHGIR